MQATQEMGGFSQEKVNQVWPCTWPWTRNTCPSNKNYLGTNLQQEQACMSPWKWEARGPTPERKKVMRTLPRTSSWNDGGQLLKRISGTQKPFPPFYLDGQVTNQLYDQHRFPHIAVFLLLPHGGQYQVQFDASRF
jgi:hypothetical protein